MADLLGQTPEQPKIEATVQEDAYVEDERKALEEEKKLEQEQDFLEQEDTEAPTSKVEQAPPSATAVAVQTPKDEVMIEVEKVLEDGLADVYKSLPDSAKPIFKKKGEETASTLAQMVRSLNIQFKNALKMIRDWLLTIPKVNKFFLEQEAKLKVDMLKELVDERKGKSLDQP